MGAREYVVGSEIEDGNIPYSNCSKSIKDSWFVSISTPVPTSTGLPRPGPLALCILKAQDITTKGGYRLSHAIYYCS